MKVRINFTSIPSQEYETDNVDKLISEKWGHLNNLLDIGGSYEVLEDAAPEVVEEVPKRSHSKKVAAE